MNIKQILTLLFVIIASNSIGQKTKQHFVEINLGYSTDFNLFAELDEYKSSINSSVGIGTQINNLHIIKIEIELNQGYQINLPTEVLYFLSNYQFYESYTKSSLRIVKAKLDYNKRIVISKGFHFSGNVNMGKCYLYRKSIFAYNTHEKQFEEVISFNPVDGFVFGTGVSLEKNWNNRVSLTLNSGVDIYQLHRFYSNIKYTPFVLFNTRIGFKYYIN